MTTPNHPKSQADKFRDLARELEGDQDEKARKVTKAGEG